MEVIVRVVVVFFFSSRRRHTRLQGDWSSDVCSSDLRKSFTAFIVSIVAPNVANGFGGDVGLKDFRYFWFGGGKRNRKIEQLVEALQLGGALVDDSTYAVPYYAYGRRFPSGLDAHGHALVLGEGVRVRQSPGSQRPVVAILAYAVVSLPKGRSEERRVGKECRSRWSPYH